MMIDFTNEKELLNRFKGSEKKKTMEYRGKIYLLKFPDPSREKKLALSYINNVFSEYLGSKIFQSIGIDTQNVLLGTYNTAVGEQKYVCACEDFTEQDYELFEYKNLLLSDVDAQTPFDTELEEIVRTIEKNPMIEDKELVKQRFWDMFIVDTFIGNSDRHPGNWGFLCKNNAIEQLAPIYDCGSCLEPLLTDEELEGKSASEYKNLAINNYSCYKMKGKRIHTAQYLDEMHNQDCNEAVKRIVPKIDMKKIETIIEDIPCISTIRKEFYLGLLYVRKKYVLDTVYKKLVHKDTVKQPTFSQARDKINVTENSISPSTYNHNR